MAFAEVLNEEARELEAIGVDVIQFDEPAFNVYSTTSPIGASRRCIGRPKGSRARPRCISATATASRPISTGKAGSAPNGGNTSGSFPALAASRIDQVSLECANSRVPIELMGLLAGKDVLVGVDRRRHRRRSKRRTRSPRRSSAALRVVPAERLFPCTNCGMAPLDRGLAERKLTALAAGAALVRGR